MSNLEPGSGGIPYTHREIFLAADNSVGKGLATFGRLNHAELREKNSFREVVDTFETLRVIRANDTLWDELLKSEVVRKIAESEFTVEYAAKNTPDIPEETYQDVKDLVVYSNIADASRRTIEWMLQLKLVHLAIYDDTALFNKLLKNDINWVKYVPNLTTFGWNANKFDADTITQLVLYDIDEFNRDPYNSVKNNFNKLISQRNNLSDGLRSDYNVPSNHDGWIKNQSQIDNLPTHSGWSTSEWRSGDISNEALLGLLYQRPLVLSPLLVQGRLGVGEEISIVDVINGMHYPGNNFWEVDFGEDLIHSASCETASGNYGYNDRKTVRASIDAGSNLKLSSDSFAFDYKGNLSKSNTALTANASIKTQPFDVSGHNSISVSIDDSNSHTQYDEATIGNNNDGHRSGSSASHVTLDVGGETKTWSSGESPNDHDFDVSDKSTVTISFGTHADTLTMSRNNNHDYASTQNAAIDIQDITIER